VIIPFAAGFRVQLWSSRRRLNEVSMLLTLPLMALVYLSIIMHAGREELLSYALVAPVLIGMWSLSIGLAGAILEGERWLGTLELAVASPAGLPAVVFGRICLMTCLGVVPLAETWLLAWVVFDVTPVIHHGWSFAIVMVAAGWAMAGTSMLCAALFALSRTALAFQNFLTYPVYVLSGVFVPVTFLPEFLQPAARLSFLYWTADLLRDCLAPAAVADVAPRLTMIVALGTVSLVAGTFILRAVLRRNRQLGTTAYA
jgi:ABC-2 type transport system permease protein